MRIEFSHLMRGIIVPALCFAVIAPDSLAQRSTESQFRFSYTHRMRIETWDNTTTFDESAGGGNSYFRSRPSLSASWLPRRDIELTSRLTNESRYYFVPENRHFNWDEVFVDQFYLKLDSAGGRPYIVTLGRQNMFLGEGLLVADGTPLDGSRSLYFNALRLDYIINPHHTLTLFGVYQPEKDDILPRINDRDKMLVEEDQDGAGLYWTGRISTYGVEAYWIRKNVYHRGEHRILLPESRLNCLGGRAVVPVYPRLSFTGEGAFQFGKTGGADHEAFGGYAYGIFETGWPMRLPKSLSLGTIYLSGNDFYTDKNDGWDPMFARWPKCSDSYIYSMPLESQVAYWSNLRSYFFKAALDITPEIAFNFDYHYMMAPAGYRSQIPESFIDKNAERGDLFIGRLIYKLGVNATGHIVWESFVPGKYYTFPQDDRPSAEYSWARMELMLKF